MIPTRWDNGCPSGLLFFPNMNRRLLPFVLIIALSSSTWASSPNRAELEAALDRSVSQTELNITSQALAEDWERERLHLEDDLARRLPKVDRRRHRRARTAWEAFRRVEVCFQAGRFGGGSIEPLVANLSYVRVTSERVATLTDLLNELRRATD